MFEHTDIRFERTTRRPKQRPIDITFATLLTFNIEHYFYECFARVSTYRVRNTVASKYVDAIQRQPRPCFPYIHPRCLSILPSDIKALRQRKEMSARLPIFKKFPFITRFLFHPFASIPWFLVFESAVKLNRLASCPLLTEGRNKLGHLLSPLVAFPRYPMFRLFRLFRNLYVSIPISNIFFSLLISVSFPFVISVGYLVACNCSSRTCTNDRNGGTPEYNIEFL